MIRGITPSPCSRGEDQGEGQPKARPFPLLSLTPTLSAQKGGERRLVMISVLP
jgi:hypothetical protein